MTFPYLNTPKPPPKWLAYPMAGFFLLVMVAYAAIGWVGIALRQWARAIPSTHHRTEAK